MTSWGLKLRGHQNDVNIGHGNAYSSCWGGLHFIGYQQTERDQIVAQDLMLKGQYGAGSIVKQ